uniref:Uncharacterized protein n=1 Tax=Acrobeloides nanus TaxID=290746 RepID=A0A914EKI5_9BILA
MESSTSLNDGSNSIDKISDNFTSIEVDSKGSLNETSMESSAKINEGSKGELVNTKIFQNNGKGTLNQEDEKNEDNGVHYNIDPSNSTDASSEEGIYAKKNFTIPDFDNSEKVSEENHDPANNTRINLKNLVSSKIDLNNANNDDKDKNH